MPSIHHRQTGGSVFNRRILEWLGQFIDVHVHIDECARPDQKGGVWIVDSLCLQSGAVFLNRHPDVTGILIAHYLKALDPRYQASEEARTESDALSSYCAVITTSQYGSEALRRCGYAGRIAVIRPGLDGVYRRAPTERPSGECRILTVASLLPDKGLLEFIPILEDLQDLNWSWELIGDDELDRSFSSTFRDRLRISTTAPRVTARGALQPGAVLEAYDRSNIFVLPTRFESCSIVTMEAMARGLPVVAFRVGGLTGLLPDRCGLQLVAPGDAVGFRETLCGLISDQRLRLAYGELNRIASERFPSWEEAGRTVDDLLRAYA